MTDHEEKTAMTAEEISGFEKKEAKEDLWVDMPTAEKGSRDYVDVVENSLLEIESDARKATSDHHSFESQSWERSRRVVADFRPVPWFIWRISNHVFGRSNGVNKLSAGMVLGLQRLLIAAANDPFFSDTRKVKTLKRAVEVLRPDAIAALSVIHAICRRLSACQFERIWRPILDDALLRAQIGYFVGERHPSFGAGRGMLAGFAGRCGLTMTIASGNLEQATAALEGLAGGMDISKVGLSVYGCDPLQVSAMVLSASGCGRDAAFGTVSYAVAKSLNITETSEQFRWLAAFSIVELLRTGKEQDIDPSFWEALSYDAAGRSDLAEMTHSMTRSGHTLQLVL